MSISKAWEWPYSTWFRGPGGGGVLNVNSWTSVPFCHVQNILVKVLSVIMMQSYIKDIKIYLTLIFVPEWIQPMLICSLWSHHNLFSMSPVIFSQRRKSIDMSLLEKSLYIFILANIMKVNNVKVCEYICYYLKC